jgi:hypothetical protein
MLRIGLKIVPSTRFCAVVCCKGGSMLILFCLNMKAHVAYRYCGHCERTLEKLGASNTQIDDIWKTQRG